jgi:hypothetical protein
LLFMSKVGVIPLGNKAVLRLRIVVL